MAGAIRFNAEGMSLVSQRLKRDGEELQSVINSIQDTVSSLPESWEGNAAQGYMQQFEDLKPGLLATRQLVEVIANQIELSLSSMQETDSEIASRLRR